MKGIGIILLAVLFYGAMIVGEIKCIVKAVKCDWKAPYKAEVIYTASALCGIGCVVGYVTIEDGVLVTE